MIIYPYPHKIQKSCLLAALRKDPDVVLAEEIGEIVTEPGLINVTA